jgi:hypothetical protein
MDIFKYLILPMGLMIVGVLLLANFYGEYICGSYSEMTGKATKYQTLDSCYINTENGWQRYDEYKMLNIAKDSLGGV